MNDCDQGGGALIPEGKDDIVDYVIREDGKRDLPFRGEACQ